MIGFGLLRQIPQRRSSEGRLQQAQATASVADGSSPVCRLTVPPASAKLSSTMCEPPRWPASSFSVCPHAAGFFLAFAMARLPVKQYAYLRFGS